MDRYRLKNCPTCNKEHRKKGPYCSQSCHNRVRPVKESTKQKLSEALLKHHQTPEGIATESKRKRLHHKYFKNRAAELNGEYVLKDEDYVIDIPNFDDVEPKINW